MEEPLKTLDQLFRKTKAKPHLYYLPLNDVQVKEKELMKRKIEEERRIHEELMIGDKWLKLITVLEV